MLSVYACMYVCMHVCMYVLCTCSEASVGGDSWELTLRQNGTVHSPWPELPQEQYSPTQWSILQQANCNQLQAPSGPTVGRITAEIQAWRDKTRGFERGRSNPETKLKLIHNFNSHSNPRLSLSFEVAGGKWRWLSSWIKPVPCKVEFCGAFQSLLTGIVRL